MSKVGREQVLSANFFFVYPDNGITYFFGISLRDSLSKAAKGGEINIQQNSCPPSAFRLLFTSSRLFSSESLCLRIVLMCAFNHMLSSQAHTMKICRRMFSTSRSLLSHDNPLVSVLHLPMTVDINSSGCPLGNLGVSHAYSPHT